MKSQSYYLPIGSNSLPHYFGKAIILPARYFENKAADIQNRASNGILLCTKRWVKNADCSLEVLLTDQEQSSLLKVSEHFSIYLSPLPISRIKSVNFLNELQGKTTVWNVNNGAAFIPDRLVKVSQPVEVVSDDELSNFKGPDDVSDFSKKAKYYDHLLGGISLMRIAGEPYMNYSQNYFPTIGYFNTRIKEEAKKAEAENKTKYTEDFSGIFVKSDNRWGKWQTYFYQNVDVQEVESLATAEGIKVQKKLGIPQLESVNSNSVIYDLLVLSIYGESKNKSIDTFVSDVVNGVIPENKKEELSLLVGLNNGYSNLRNRYKFSNSNQVVKFELNSQLDYYIIESIFQAAFYSNRDNSSFHYIDEWIPETSEKKPAKGAFKIIDKWIVSKKKPLVFSSEYLEEFLQKNSPKEIHQMITKSVIQWCPPFVVKNEEEGEKYFENLLKGVMNNWWKKLLSQLKEDYDASLQDQKDDLINTFESEKKELNEKINSLNDKLAVLSKELDVVKSNAQSSTQNINNSEAIAKEAEIDVNEDIREDVDYSKFDVKELKRIAKEKGIKPVPQKKEDLIKAIKTIKTFL
jgi:hypothetical protein